MAPSEFESIKSGVSFRDCQTTINGERESAMSITVRQLESTRRTAILQAIAEARQRGGHQPLTLTGYCDGPDCPGREVTVFVKDYDDELDGLITKNGFVCPLCRHPLKTHYVRTREEVHREEDRLARMSVNTQLYEQAT